jgi:hypothetical protein
MSRDVSDFVEDTEDGVGEGIACAKGLKAMHMKSQTTQAENREANQQQVALERSQILRDVKITLPKLKFLDEPENEL